MILQKLYDFLTLTYKKRKHRRIISQLEKIIGKVELKITYMNHKPILSVLKNNVYQIDIISERTNRITILEHYPIYGINYPRGAVVLPVYKYAGHIRIPVNTCTDSVILKNWWGE